MKYPTIDHVVRTFFGYNSGLDMEQFFEQELVDDVPLPIDLLSELNAALSDSEFLWMPLLKKAGIARAEEVHTEDEAKAWVKTRVIEQYLAKYM